MLALAWLAVAVCVPELPVVVSSVSAASRLSLFFPAFWRMSACSIIPGGGVVAGLPTVPKKPMSSAPGTVVDRAGAGIEVEAGLGWRLGGAPRGRGAGGEAPRVRRGLGRGRGSDVDRLTHRGGVRVDAHDGPSWWWRDRGCAADVHRCDQEVACGDAGWRGDRKGRSAPGDPGRR